MGLFCEGACTFVSLSFEFARSLVRKGRTTRLLLFSLGERDGPAKRARETPSNVTSEKNDGGFSLLIHSDFLTLSSPLREKDRKCAWSWSR